VSESWLYRLEDVTRCYGDRTVLNVSRLTIAANEVLALIGPTGAGKSTLLRLLAALEPPTSGRLHFESFSLDERALPLDVRRRITLVFQRPLLLAGSVRDNVAYGLRLRGVPRHSPRIQEALDLFGLGKLANRTARTLSGGETQLVARARAFALRPAVLLLDEPTNNLDPARVAVVEEAVAGLRRHGSTTVVWATHNLFQARRVADRVVLFLDGQLVEAAPTEEFFTAPHDPRSAAFVQGKMVY
jgi:tungstate transport system ATP-binding protein